jgi:DNA-binding transcriptional ArsR family regulator
MNQDVAVARLKALAHPVRLRILDLLAQEELSVGELTEILGMAQSRVSGHLGVLRESALVQDRRQGTSAFYSPVPEGEGRATWDAIRGTLPESIGQVEDRRRLAETLARRRERGREFFDRVAARWDEGRSESLGLHAGGFALAGLLPPETVVLDLGTGTGSLLPLLGSYVDRVVAVDLSRAMLERARERLGPRTWSAFRSETQPWTGWWPT